MFIDDLKLYGKDERELDSLVNTVMAFSTGYRQDVWYEKAWLSYLKEGKC